LNIDKSKKKSFQNEDDIQKPPANIWT